ncbi:endonuclease/exonuclease/phosphatase family metal-dependent hydrolase [Tenacibaculum adriaticum]|uniref:Endonuclease/exonuclease/phosphatase family metal-dependent hydrolase n=1 Tax=Tenacibaculum adriaticum TaxID=413713 RepID=A0A5S5DPK0_9FLAO|nr:endonuclease/exonuclease/phosphatase family protein [Tenacibaculum adriaticum]TYP97880.1 endonuclease/exonuclease/phosphatase family metal-dependent hydrolase [Tenacibaculum adriaticum]
MKRLIKLLFALLLLLIISFSVFFVWASSPTLDEKEYAQLIEYNYPTSTDTDSIYSIVTYNIGYLSGMTNNRAIAKPKELFDENLEKVRTEIKKVNPDIIAFQEIDYKASRSFEVNQEEEIAKLGYNYVAKGVNWDERYLPYPYWPPSMHFGKVVSGQSIISKYPLKDYERIVLERVADSPFYRDALYLERLAQVVKVTLEGKEVVLINVHLEAFDKPTRIKQFHYVLELFNKYKNEYPTILLGDFNSRARDKQAIVRKMFIMEDVGSSALNLENPSNTFDTKDLYERIDYIFYTKNSIEYVDGRVLNEFDQASDHLPVEMRFKIK